MYVFLTWWNTGPIGALVWVLASRPQGLVFECDLGRFNPSGLLDVLSRQALNHNKEHWLLNPNCHAQYCYFNVWPLNTRKYYQRQTRHEKKYNWGTASMDNCSLYFTFHHVMKKSIARQMYESILESKDTKLPLPNTI
jgi:hypothetical protein